MAIITGKRVRTLLFSFRNRVVIVAVGLVIGVSSLLFTGNMARELRNKELSEVAMWSFAMRRLGGMFDRTDPIVQYILSDKNNIPFIITDRNLNVVGHANIPEKVLTNPVLLRKKLEAFSNTNQPFEVITWNETVFYIFYGESFLLKTLVYFPYIQMIVVGIFLLFGYITFRSSRNDEQNRVWIGLAKETAHQLGTPTSSLLGWIEYLNEEGVEPNITEEMCKDLHRLTKVVDRFSKIGSETELVETNINEVVGECVQYFITRLPKNITLRYNGYAIAPIEARINTALFEWVIENLIKNSIDAMTSGSGNINVTLRDDDKHIIIDISDTGRGIPKANFQKIFNPGFTTKTRGWGLGLSLSKRVIEVYHKGRIFVAESESDKGTTIRIALKRTRA